MPNANIDDIGFTYSPVNEIENKIINSSIEWKNLVTLPQRYNVALFKNLDRLYFGVRREQYCFELFDLEEGNSKLLKLKYPIYTDKSSDSEFFWCPISVLTNTINYGKN